MLFMPSLSIILTGDSINQCFLLTIDCFSATKSSQDLLTRPARCAAAARSDASIDPIGAVMGRALRGACTHFARSPDGDRLPLLQPSGSTNRLICRLSVS